MLEIKQAFFACAETQQSNSMRLPDCGMASFFTPFGNIIHAVKRITTFGLSHFYTNLTFFMQNPLFCTFNRTTKVLQYESPEQAFLFLEGIL